MWSNQIFIILLSIILFTACKQDKTGEVEELSTAANESSSAVHSYDDDYLVSVYEAQELVKISDNNPELRKKYCEKAFDKDRQVFISMGIARLYQDDGSEIPRQMVERAALLDAVRWASYGEIWMTNNYEPSYGKLETTYKHPNTVINRARVGDSLFVFLETQIMR